MNLASSRVLALLAWAAAAASLPPQLALARPAACLVIMEGPSDTHGRCAFVSEAGGEVITTRGARPARLVVDPGAREGRALSAEHSPTKPESGIIGDLRSSGAC